MTKQSNEEVIVSKAAGWRLVPVGPTEEMRLAGAMGWWGHRCYGVTTEEGRATDQCWQNNERCHCRIAYEGTLAGYRAMLAVSPSPAPDSVGEEPTDELIRAYAIAADGIGAEKGSYLWEEIERGLRAVLRALSQSTRSTVGGK